MMAHSSSSLLVPQHPTRPLQPRRPTLRFWCLMPKGRGIEYIRLRRSNYLSRGSLVFYYIWFLCVIHYYAFVCLLLCIKLYLCDSDIYVIMICDMCALYFESFICHITCVMLICFASVFYSDANELYYLYSCLFHIF